MSKTMNSCMWPIHRMAARWAYAHTLQDMETHDPHASMTHMTYTSHVATSPM
jgi:hypothetical protein